jgi:hypothetical protein
VNDWSYPGQPRAGSEIAWWWPPFWSSLLGGVLLPFFALPGLGRGHSPATLVQELAIVVGALMLALVWLAAPWKARPPAQPTLVPPIQAAPVLPSLHRLATAGWLVVIAAAVVASPWTPAVPLLPPAGALETTATRPAPWWSLVALWAVTDLAVLARRLREPPPKEPEEAVPQAPKASRLAQLWREYLLVGSAGDEPNREGLLLALDRDTVDALERAGSDEAVLAVVEELEDAVNPELDERLWVDAGTDWDAIHRCLTDGTLRPGNGSFPLNRTILGGRELYQGDDRFVGLTEAGEVGSVAAALEQVSEATMRWAYDALDPEDYGSELSEEDFESVWETFQWVRELWTHAAKAGLAVMFTAAQ